MKALGRPTNAPRPDLFFGALAQSLSALKTSDPRLVLLLPQDKDDILSERSGAGMIVPLFDERGESVWPGPTDFLKAEKESIAESTRLMREKACKLVSNGWRV